MQSELEEFVSKSGQKKIVHQIEWKKVLERKKVAPQSDLESIYKVRLNKMTDANIYILKQYGKFQNHIKIHVLWCMC